MVQSQLRALRTAVDSGDRQQAVALADELIEAFDADRARVRAQAGLARAAREQLVGTTPVVTAASAVLETAPRTNETKIAVDTDLLPYLRGEPPGELAATLSTAIDAHDRFDERVAAFRSAVETAETTLPGRVAVTAPSQFVAPKETAIDGTVTVRNDTPQPVTDVTVSVSAAAPLRLSPTSIDEVPPGETVAVQIDGTPAAGEYQPTITASANGVSDTASPYLLVQHKGTYLEQAVDELTEIYEAIAVAGAEQAGSGSGNGSGNGNGNGGGSGGSPVPPGIDNTARTIVERTIAILDEVNAARTAAADAGQQGTPPAAALNNQIGAVINQVGALQAQVAAQAGQQLAAAADPRLQQELDGLIDVYEAAQTAAI